MSDVNTPVTGKDYSLTITVDGVLRQVQDQITNFTPRQVNDEIVTKNLGVTGSKIDKEFTHWEGTVELAIESAVLDEMADAISLARRNRVPVVININETIRYRDGSVRRYIYPDVKIDFERSATRGEAARFTLNWKTGLDRIRG